MFTLQGANSNDPLFMNSGEDTPLSNTTLLQARSRS